MNLGQFAEAINLAIASKHLVGNTDDIEVYVRDLDTGYLTPIDTIQISDLADRTVIVIDPVNYSDDRFPWDDESMKTGGY